jgi:uncharacterized protein YycO
MSRHSHLDEPCILLMRGRGGLSWLIRSITHSPVSHAAIYCGNGYLVEAWQGAGVREKEIRSWENVSAYAVRGMTPLHWERAIDLARRQIGAGYDYSAVLRFVSGNYDSPHATNGKWFCSELVHWAIRRSFCPLTDLTDNRVHPGMLVGPVPCGRTCEVALPWPA